MADPHVVPIAHVRFDDGSEVHVDRHEPESIYQIGVWGTPQSYEGSSLFLSREQASEFARAWVADLELEVGKAKDGGERWIRWSRSPWHLIGSVDEQRALCVCGAVANLMLRWNHRSNGRPEDGRLCTTCLGKANTRGGDEQ